ncbi:MAG: hypothetical protein JXA95_10135 [Spirochaetales bacterium]|nr:hypothetical protein [Spirochaetales bacterium]
MKKLASTALILLFSALFLSCSPRGSQIQVNFAFDKSRASDWKNAYVIWLENEEGQMQHLYVCKRILDGSLTDGEFSLPFWHLNRYDGNDAALKADVDSVTGATKANRDFTVKADIDPALGQKFTLYFEYDQSFQFNDWFPGAPYNMFDQPSVLYKAQIDLSRGAADYTLEPVGFVPMYDSYPDMVLTPADEEAVRNGTKTFARGVLFEEMGYITRARITDGSGNPAFGEIDSVNGALRSVKSITAEVK